jgi:phosphoribosylformylglycinamidine synthase subunit PurQ / glutaminase
MSGARVAVVQFPGVNCEAETVRALARVGLDAEIFRWTRPAEALEVFDAYVIPGGFSYQDRLRAGALASRDPLVEVLARGAARGRPVLGICNGAQVLVEAGLVPEDGVVQLALARNRMPERTGYFSHWCHVRVESSHCVFTRKLEAGTVLAMPMAHGEGRFTSRTPGLLERLVSGGRTPFRYVTVAGELATTHPDNPSGSELAIAAVCNSAGNVLALMPHPERAQDLGQLGRSVGGEWADRRDHALMTQGTRALDAPGPGLALFEGLRRHLRDA